MFFKNRTLKLTVEKDDKKETYEVANDGKPFEEKAEEILLVLERMAKKAFVGVCIYVVLDTYRQATVAKAIYHPQQ